MACLFGLGSLSCAVLCDCFVFHICGWNSLCGVMCLHDILCLCVCLMVMLILVCMLIVFIIICVRTLVGSVMCMLYCFVCCAGVVVVCSVVLCCVELS